MLSRNFGPDNVAITSSWLITEAFGLLSLVAIVAAAVFASTAVLRDDEFQMRELIYSSPVGRFPYLISRFAGAFLATLGSVACSAVGLIAGTLTLAESSRVGAIDPLSYFSALAIITVPNVLLVTALLFSFATLSRNAMATYAVAIALYIAYFASAALTESPLMAASRAGGGGGALASLLDPTGLTSFFDLTRHWTPAEKNSRFVGLAGLLATNRLLWIAIAAATLTTLYRTFRFTLRQRAPKKRIESTEPRVAPASLALPVVVTGAPSWFASWRSSSAIELRSLATKSSLLLLLLWIALALSEIRGDVLAQEYDSLSWPTTSLIIDALWSPVTLLGMILIVYTSAEIFWRERHDRIAQLIDSTPVQSSVLIAAKWTALAAMIAALLAGGAIAGISVQVARGWFSFEPLVYLSFFYFAGVPLLLWSALALFVHSLSPGKYAGMIGVALCVILLRSSGSIGLEHPLWRFGQGPSLRHGDLNGFGYEGAVFHQFALHWSLVALLLLAIATMLWRRIGLTVRERMRFVKPSPMMAGLALGALLTGGWIFYDTNVARDYVTSEELLDWKADYERTWKHIESMPRPTIVAVDTQIDLEPERRAVRIAGSYELVNRTADPIDTLFIAVRRDGDLASLSVDSAHLTTTDTRFGMHEFEINPPLASGARTTVRFDLRYDDIDDFVLENGSWLMSFRAFPSLGYRRSYELTSDAERAKRGLSGSGTTALEADGSHGAIEGSEEEWIDLRATVTTAGNQLALAPGRMVASGEKGARRWFRYQTDAPILNRFAIASARYAVARRQHGDVAIEVYHHPSHAVNVPHMLDTAVATLDVMQSRFGRYPHRELRVIELASHWPMAGFALPGAVYINEARGFLTDRRDNERPDLVARRIAHEVAHQWFGHTLHAPNVEGASVLIESLTKYAELLVIEKLHGREAVRRFLEIELDRYLSGRANASEPEVPLVRTQNQAYLFYSKGAIALWSIQQLISEDAMTDAIRAIMRQERPTAMSLTNELLARAEPGDRQRIDEWMRSIVLHDLQLESVTATPRADGRYDVLLDVSAAKFVDDGVGNTKAVPMNEEVEIEFAFENGTAEVQRHMLRSGPQRVPFVLNAAPASVNLDPWITRIERTPRNDAFQE